MTKKLQRYLEISRYPFCKSVDEIFWCFCKCVSFGCLQEEDGTGGDQDQEERRWNKRTQQMLHGLQVHIIYFLLR